MKLVASFLLFTITALASGFILEEISMDAATYEACSTCDAR